MCPVIQFVFRGCQAVVLDTDADGVRRDVNGHADIGDTVAHEGRPHRVSRNPIHVFGPLERDAVVLERRFTRAADGRYMGFEPG